MTLFVASVVASALIAPPTASDAKISALMLQHDPILHWARRLLPAQRANAASALYAWCRRLDELVDEPGLSEAATLSRLDEWSARLDELCSGQPRDEMDAALLATMQEHPTLGREPFDEMLRGMRADAGAGECPLIELGALAHSDSHIR